MKLNHDELLSNFAFNCNLCHYILAASFVQSGEDVRLIRKILDEHGGTHVKIISKIENEEGVTNIDDILKYTVGLVQLCPRLNTGSHT